MKGIAAPQKLSKRPGLSLLLAALFLCLTFAPTCSAQDAPDPLVSEQSQSNFFSSAPLSGGVTVIDHLKPNGMRLKRATVPSDVSAASQRPANHHELPLTGDIEGEGTRFQALFPSIDGDQGLSAAAAKDPLSGNAQQDKTSTIKAARPHYIWQKSPLGGYYDASGNTHDVIKGNQLYKFGGTMADGLTPAPSGPVEQNSMGYIMWQPIHGGPPGWY
ncbi:MAG: hypothetical protein KGS72_15930 [Cyanobacteria bacterium REEB67]|nr:hypothetical protein [Cyanobacteria bacterium REEB67]